MATAPAASIAPSTINRTADGSYVGSVNAAKPDGQQLTVASVNTLVRHLLDGRSNRNRLATDKTAGIRDDSWVKQSFAVSFQETGAGATPDLTIEDTTNRFYSPAIHAYTDTSMGGSIAINPRPQFNPYADIRAESVMRHTDKPSIGSTGRLGIGRYYYEAYTQNEQHIHLRFGVPQFNSLSTFFKGFYNGSAGNAARTGRIDKGFFASLGFVTGMVVSVLYVPLLVMSVLGGAFRFFMQKPSSKFYYLKPTMSTYWLAVTAMVNQIAVNRGLYPRVPIVGDSTATSGLADDSQKIGSGYKIDQAAMERLHDLMPDIFSKSGGIDVYNAANKAQRMQNQFNRDLQAGLADGSIANYKGFVNKGSAAVATANAGRKRDIKEVIDGWLSTEYGSIGTDNNGSDAEIDIKAKIQSENSDPNFKGTPTQYPTNTSDYFEAEFNDGAAFATFRVDYTGSASESFSNSFVESDLQQKFNSTSSQARSARFTFADGNAIGGAVGAVIGGVTQAVKDFATGTLDALNVSGIMALGGSAFVDIPKHWDTASATLNHTTYTMTLTSPYGNPISQITNIYLPLCMLLCGALPLATGPQSHTAPFICELYDKGRSQTRLGMIDSISITRGTSNLGFNREGYPLAVDVSFSVADLSSIVAIPLSQAFSLNPTSIFNDETAYSDYVAVLSSLSLSQQIYAFNKFKLNIAQKIRSVENITSPSLWAGFAHESNVIGWADIFFKGTERR